MSGQFASMSPYRSVLLNAQYSSSSVQNNRFIIASNIPTVPSRLNSLSVNNSSKKGNLQSSTSRQSQLLILPREKFHILIFFMLDFYFK
jgi:hypothetical protein